MPLEGQDISPKPQEGVSLDRKTHILAVLTDYRSSSQPLQKVTTAHSLPYLTLHNHIQGCKTHSNSYSSQKLVSQAQENILISWCEYQASMTESLTLLDTEIPSWHKIDPLLLLWLSSRPPSEISDTTQLIPENHNTISSSSKNPNWSPRPLTTFQFLLFYFSSLALHFQFHILISVFSFPFLIYCTISIFLLSCSSLHSTVRH